MHIGLSITPFGHHPSAWRRAASANAIHFNRLAAQVDKAQEGGLDFVLLADRFGQRPATTLSPQAVPFEPTTLAAALATVAGEIGIIATAALAQHEPYNLARRFASLDTIGGGRSGWNLVVAPEMAQAADEYVAVVEGLWDSWEDDAFLYDKETGRFFDPDKMHVLSHRGERYTVRGPLNVNRSPQGRPVVCTPFAPQTLDLAAARAEVVFLDAATLEQAKRAVADLETGLERRGRNRADVKIFANVIAHIGAARAAAEEARRALDALGPDAAGPAGAGIAGTPEQVADLLQEWGEVVDGFTLLPPTVPDGIDGFVDAVVPELAKRGLFRRAYDGTTLRAHLRLSRPPHPANSTGEHAR